jgi:hypothetical protein
MRATFDHNFLPGLLLNGDLFFRVIHEFDWRPITYRSRSTGGSRQSQAHFHSIVQVEGGKWIPWQPEKVVIVIGVCRLVVIPPRTLIRRNVLPCPDSVMRNDNLGRRLVYDGMIWLMYHFCVSVGYRGP